MAKPEQLGVWLDGVHVADLTQQRWPAIRCRYREDALARWPRNSPVLSCSLPLQPREAVAWNHPAERAEAIAHETIAAVLKAIDEERIPSRSNVAELVRARARQLG